MFHSEARQQQAHLFKQNILKGTSVSKCLVENPFTQTCQV